MSFFEVIPEEVDNHPIVLIDSSGSTESDFNKKKVFDEEHYRISDILTSKAVETCDIIYWSDKSKLISNVSVKYMTQNIAMPFSGGTYLSQAIDNITLDKNKKMCDIYIVTDGEIGDGITKFKLSILNLLEKNSNINIYVITVEPNSNNYQNGKCNAGNTLFKHIRELRLTNKIRSFVSFNKISRFESFSNPKVIKDYIPFDNKVFHINRLNEFLNYLSKLILGTEDTNLLKHKLSGTIYHICKDKSERMKVDIIAMFSKLFVKDNYDTVYQMFSSEVLNHTNNMSTSYYEYINNRTKLFERAQSSLSNDVKSNISYGNIQTYISLPILDTNSNQYVIFEASANLVKETVRLGYSEYKNGGILVNNSVIPVFPNNICLELETKAEFIRQCTRQYIRAIYSRQYSRDPSDDTILYLFLTQMLVICSSNVSNDIKKVYRDLGFVMLDRKRFGTGVKEIEYLRKGNPPSGVTELSNIEDIFNFCSKTFNLSIFDKKPYSLWYAIVLALEDPILIKNQLEFCNTGIDTITTTIKTESLIKTENAYDYYCYNTMTSTINTGGFLVPTHNICGTVCNAKYVMSAPCDTCPLCQTALNKEDFAPIQPKKYYDKSTKLYDYKFKEDSHDVLNFRNIYNLANTLEKLYTLENINLKTISYSSDIPIFTKKLGSSLVINNTTEAFLNTVIKKYNFLTRVNFKNICIGGGFNRSILLDQSVNDIDIFFYGLNKDEIRARLDVLVKDLVSEIKKEYQGIIFMILYKQNTNVFEILCLDSKDKAMLVEDIDFVMNNKEQYNAILKIQIILRQYDNILDIINSFDLWASAVAFDMQNIYFNEKSKFAYKYMVNLVDENAYSDQYEYRLQKYFDNGFSIVMPNLDTTKLENNMRFATSNFALDISNKNVITIEDYSLDKNKGITKTSLYKSALYSGTKNGITNILKYIELTNKDKTIINYKIFNDAEPCNKFEEVIPLTVTETNFKYFNDWYGKYRKVNETKDLVKDIKVTIPIYKKGDGITKFCYTFNEFPLFIRKQYPEYNDLPIIKVLANVDSIKDNETDGLYYISTNNKISLYNKITVKQVVPGWIYDGEDFIPQVKKIATYYTKKN